MADDGRRAHKEEEVTPELTGNDAPPDQAQMGSAGNGASYVCDLLGATPESLSFEQEAENEDVLPDHIETMTEVSDEDAEEVELTAQPSDIVPNDVADFP